MKVQVINLRKEFGKTVAVDNISFAFDSGHIFGFVGPNGAGKTTTMRIISTIEDPTDGDVRLNGFSVREEPELARRMVGYVPDTLPAHADITVHEYLDFFARAYGLRGAARTKAVEAIEEFTNVAGIRDKHLKALSKGMKQRVSLGRALVYDPDVLVLDEPAAGLDPRARVELRELLLVLAERKKAILISSHILTELTEICNGVVIIDRGRILETGTIDDVLKKSAPRRTVAVRLLDGQQHLNPQLLKALLQMPHVENARDVANEIHFELAGEAAMACDILDELVAQKFRVIEFRQTKVNLEDIFMTVTKEEGPMTAVLGRLKSHFRNWRQWELNPVVLKELRQAVRNLAVVGMLHLFLIVLFITAIIMLASDSLHSDGNQRLGGDIFQAFLVVLAGASVLFIPLYVGVRLAAERPAGNLNLLYISTLSPGRIIRGKFYCGVYMAALFFSACLPFMAFTNLLRGVDLPSMFVVLTFLFLMVCAVNMLAIFLACLPMSVPFKVLLALYGLFQGAALVIPVVFSSFAMMESGIGAMVSGKDFWIGFGTAGGIGLAGVLLLYLLAVALISPPSANRALPVRVYMSGMWLVALVGSLVWVYHARDARLILPWGMISYILFTIALLVTICSHDELSIRVQRDIPRSRLRRILAFPFFNGAASGLVWVAGFLVATWVCATLVVYPGGVPGMSMPSFTPDKFQEFAAASLALVLYTLAYALTGLFIHRRFLPKRIPKFAGIITGMLAGLWAIIPNFALFFAQRFDFHAIERLQLGNVCNVFMVRNPDYRAMHIAFAAVWLALMLVANAGWFRAQVARFKPYERAAPPPPPPLPN